MKKDKIVNQDHPIYLGLWKSHQVRDFEDADLPEVLREQVTIDHESDEDAGYLQVPIHTFSTGKGGIWYLYQFENGFVAPVSGPMGGELGIYPTLGQAFDASFADWYPESMHGDFNDDVTEYIVDGQWLIRLQQS